MRHEAWRHGGAKAPSEALGGLASPDRTPSLLSPFGEQVTG